MGNSKPLSGGAPEWKRWLFGWIPFWIYSLLVIKSALLPAEEIPPVIEFFNDKFLHGVQYFLLFLFSVNAFRRARMVWLYRSSGASAFIYSILLGAVTEVAQLTAHGRSPDVKDWVADVAGILIALILCRLFAVRRPQVMGG